MSRWRARVAFSDRMRWAVSKDASCSHDPARFAYRSRTMCGRDERLRRGCLALAGARCGLRWVYSPRAGGNRARARRGRLCHRVTGTGPLPCCRHIAADGDGLRLLKPTSETIMRPYLVSAARHGLAATFAAPPGPLFTPARRLICAAATSAREGLPAQRSGSGSTGRPATAALHRGRMPHPHRAVRSPASSTCARLKARLAGAARLQNERSINCANRMRRIAHRGPLGQSWRRLTTASGERADLVRHLQITFPSPSANPLRPLRAVIAGSERAKLSRARHARDRSARAPSRARACGSLRLASPASDPEPDCQRHSAVMPTQPQPSPAFAVAPSFRSPMPRRRWRFRRRSPEPRRAKAQATQWGRAMRAKRP